METEQRPCDRDRIERFLDGRLAPAEEAQLESHLDECSTCRRQLDSSAADEADWRAMAIHLRDDALDDESGTSLVGITGALTGEPHQPHAALGITRYLDPTDDPRMLGRFGGYEIVGVIGCGGMGVVLKGFEPALDRYVAIKVLAPHLATSGAARARFAREARAAAAVLHENVVAIHRVAEAAGLPYLVMPYTPGESLEKRLAERGPLSLVEILRIGMQTAAGLAAAHAQGLVHRDIKPGNILLQSGVERVAITDFGLARAADDASLTRSGVIAGTPQYMSSEQARGLPLDGRSDLFSLGSMLYAMCTGRPPFRAESAMAVLRRICQEEPQAIRTVNPDIPDWLEEIVARLHAKSPDDRFQSAHEVADLLERHLAHVQHPTAVPQPPRLTRPAAQKAASRRWWAWPAAALAIALAAVVTTSVILRQDPSPAPKSAARPPSRMAEVSSSVIYAAEDERAWQEGIAESRNTLERLERQWLAPPVPAEFDRWAAVASDVDEILIELEATANVYP